MSSAELPRSALIVLAAGRSSRMGRPKALLRFGVRSALEIAVDNALAAGVNEIVTVLGHDARTIRRAHDFSRLGSAFRWLENPRPDLPMLSSLKCGLLELDPSRLDVFLFQPVDYPLVVPEDFRRLLRAFERRSGESRVFRLRWRGRGGHPVLCHVALRDEFLALGDSDSPRDVLGRHESVTLESANAGVVEDMDTPEDYERLVDIFAGRDSRSRSR